MHAVVSHLSLQGLVASHVELLKEKVAVQGDVFAIPIVQSYLFCFQDKFYNSTVFRIRKYTVKGEEDDCILRQATG